VWFLAGFLHNNVEKASAQSLVKLQNALKNGVGGLETKMSTFFDT